jgi:hypothetical protein
MTAFTHGLIIGIASPILLAVALATLYLARAEYQRVRPVDDPYRALRFEARRPLPSPTQSAPVTPAIPHSAWRDRLRRWWYSLRKHVYMVEGEEW